MTTIRTVRFGVLLACLSVLFGFGLGAVFGAFEEDLKGHLKARGEAVLAERYEGDAGKLKVVLDKSWVYVQRAHLHGGGIGAVALALCLLLASLGSPSTRLAAVAALLAGAGALGYAVYWLLAALRAPGLGGTSAAKATLEWLAVPTSGMAITGLLLTIWLVVRSLFGGPRSGAG
jgi:hypothetical protein